MTKPKEETVTLENVPLSWARGVFNMRDGSISPEDRCMVRASIGAALDARKDPYDRWKDSLFKEKHIVYLKKDGWSVNNSRLMAAAPQLLEALVRIRSGTRGYETLEAVLGRGFVSAAIRAAVPADVADFLLSEGTK